MAQLKPKIVHKVVVIWIDGKPELWLCIKDEKGTYIPMCGPLKLPQEWRDELSRKPE